MAFALAAQDPGLVGMLSSFNTLGSNTPYSNWGTRLAGDNVGSLDQLDMLLSKPKEGGLFSDLTGMDKFKLGLGSLQTLGGLFLGLKQLGLANKQFNFQRDFANTNLTNQIQSYNTTLADKARARSVMETGVDNSQAYVDKNKLAARTL